MSRKISSESRSPVRKFVEYRGGEGRFEYYDKELKKRVPLELPLRFVVLDDTRLTVTGFNDTAGTGIYANEVGHISAPLSVKTFKGDAIAEGPWKKISDRVEAKGGKFCKVVYGAMKVDPSEENPSGFEYVAFKFAGSSLGPWFDFQKSADLTSGGVEILDEFEEGKKGTTKFKIPVFKSIKLSKETLDIADRMSDPLQDYFKKYDSQKPYDGSSPDESGSDLPPVSFDGNTSKEGAGKSDTFKGFGEPSSNASEDTPDKNVVETPDGYRNKNYSDEDLPF